MVRLHTLRKRDRIYLRDEVRALFASKTSYAVYPFRVVLLEQPRKGDDAALKVLISAPKKRLRRAHLRNLVKRRFREAYRTERHALTEAVESREGEPTTLLIGFIYIADKVHSYHRISGAVTKALDYAVSWVKKESDEADEPKEEE